MSITIYLYHKQHNVTRMNYFGKTIQMNKRKNPWSYSGSGKHWSYHLKKHGRNVTTINVWGFDTQEQATEFAIWFSKTYDIVNSKQWANEVIETALDGTTIWTEQMKEKMRKPKTSTINMSLSHAKIFWTVINPNGEKQIIKNLTEFCRKNNLNQSHMVQVAKGKSRYSSHKGWKCYKTGTDFQN